MISDIHIDVEAEITQSEIVENILENIVVINETKTPPKVEMITYTDSSFNNGIAIGVIIGIAIGIAFIFIIRQKPPK